MRAKSLMVISRQILGNFIIVIGKLWYSGIKCTQFMPVTYHLKKCSYIKKYIIQKHILYNITYNICKVMFKHINQSINIASF